jgi:hypothetical protein
MSLKVREEDVAQLIAHMRAIYRPGAESAPDLLDASTLQDKHTAWQVATEVCCQLSSLLYKSVICELTQRGPQPVLQPRNTLYLIAQPVVR